MVENDKSRKLSMLLLQESLWGIEEKLNVIMDTLTEHEVELMKVKRQLKEILTQLNCNGNSNDRI